MDEKFQKTVDEIYSKIPDRKLVNQELYHYTSPEGLLGIISNKGVIVGHDCRRLYCNS